MELCTSPWSSPIVPVKEPDGSIRLCVDYRRLNANAATVPDPLYTLLIEDMLDQVGDSTFLSKIELSKSFYKVPIRDED